MTEFGTHILILSPHPDDEVVAYCTMIGQAQEKGAKLYVMHLTHGRPAKELMWPWTRHLYTKRLTTRRQEAERAAKELGIELISISERPARTLWSHLREAKEEIKTAIKEFEIDQLWVPAYEGGNADHDGLNGMVASLKEEISIIEFAAYNYAGGKVNSHKFPVLHGTETIHTLDDDEKAFKQSCLELYVSEQHNLGYVEKECESFRPLVEYNYTKPAHEGTLWYKRFNWVPFPHPRIDRTKPEDVCESIKHVQIGF